MKLKFLLLISAVCVLFSSCSLKQEEPETKTVFAMDTVMTLSAYGENANQALKEAEEEIFRLDKLFRRKDENSDVYKINQGSAEVSDDTVEILKTAISISEKTNGAFDITVAPVMDLWGFYEKDYHLPTEAELDEVLPKVNYKNLEGTDNTVTMHNGSQIDLGGIAKGYLSDRIARIFRKNEVDYGIISLGGNVMTVGQKPKGEKWKVAIQNPDDENEYSGVISVDEKAVVTSGGYQRFFEKDGVTYHHIINPMTGFPARSGLKSVTVVANGGAKADALSTAFFVMGRDRAVEMWRHYNFGYDIVFITENDEIYITKGLEDSFESENEYEVIE